MYFKERETDKEFSQEQDKTLQKNAADRLKKNRETKQFQKRKENK